MVVYFLGSITAASGAYNNAQTGASGIGTFAIPLGLKSVYLFPSASGMFFEFGASGGFKTTDQRGAMLDGPGLLSGPFRMVAGSTGMVPVVAVYNSVGGFVSVRVYASPTS